MPLGSGMGLCYIDRVKSRNTQKNFKKLGSPSTDEINRFNSNKKIQNIVIILPCEGFPIF